MNICTLSPNGEKFIRKPGIEGNSLVPYLDSGGMPTIGSGCTTYEDGSRVKMSDPAITPEHSTSLFRNRAKIYIDWVNRVIIVPLKQYQFDALVCMCFNCGCPKFSLSQVVKYLNAGDMDQVVEWWPKSFVTSNGVPVNGLVNRRKAELHLFLTGDYQI